MKEMTATSNTTAAAAPAVIMTTTTTTMATMTMTTTNESNLAEDVKIQTAAAANDENSMNSNNNPAPVNETTSAVKPTQPCLSFAQLLKRNLPEVSSPKLSNLTILSIPASQLPSSGTANSSNGSVNNQPQSKSLSNGGKRTTTTTTSTTTTSKQTSSSNSSHSNNNNNNSNSNSNNNNSKKPMVSPTISTVEPPSGKRQTAGNGKSALPTVDATTPESPARPSPSSSRGNFSMPSPPVSEDGPAASINSATVVDGGARFSSVSSENGSDGQQNSSVNTTAAVAPTPPPAVNVWQMRMAAKQHSKPSTPSAADQDFPSAASEGNIKDASQHLFHCDGEEESCETTIAAVPSAAGTVVATTFATDASAAADDERQVMDEKEKKQQQSKEQSAVALNDGAGLIEDEELKGLSLTPKSLPDIRSTEHSPTTSLTSSAPDYNPLASASQQQQQQYYYRQSNAPGRYGSGNYNNHSAPRGGRGRGVSSGSRGTGYHRSTGGQRPPMMRNNQASGYYQNSSHNRKSLVPQQQQAAVNVAPTAATAGAYIQYIPVMDWETLKYCIMAQIEYYFSIENLCRDMYFRKQMDAEGFVPITLIANFNRVKALSLDLNFIKESIAQSAVIEIVDDKVRKREDWHLWVLPGRVGGEAALAESLPAEKLTPVPTESRGN